MPVAIACPGCKRSISVKKEWLGKWIACPRCGMEFAALRSEPTNEIPETEYPEPPATSSLDLEIVGWVAVGLMLMLGVIFTVLAIRSSGNADVTWAKVKQYQPAPRPSGVLNLTSVATGVRLLLWFLFLPTAVIAAWVLVLAWVARDSRSRGVDGGAVWVITVFFTGPIGLLVYLASRPYGILVVCPNCNNKKLNFAKLCPHCGHGEAKRRRAST